jgi:hypothetical protein
LASAVFTQVLSPTEPAARPYPTAMGQLLGVAGGCAAVLLTGAAAAPSFLDHHPLLLARVAAVGIAVAITAALQIVCQAGSPAGGATAAVVALGIETADAAAVVRLVAGVALVTGLGEVARRCILTLDSRSAR